MELPLSTWYSWHACNLQIPGEHLSLGERYALQAEGCSLLRRLRLVHLAWWLQFVRLMQVFYVNYSCVSCSSLQPWNTRLRATWVLCTCWRWLDENVFEWCKKYLSSFWTVLRQSKCHVTLPCYLWQATLTASGFVKVWFWRDFARGVREWPPVRLTLWLDMSQAAEP